MTKLVVWRRFLEVETPEYVDRYVTQHVGAPNGERPSAHLRAFFQRTGDDRAYIGWDEHGWRVQPFDGWSA